MTKKELIEMLKEIGFEVPKDNFVPVISEIYWFVDTDGAVDNTCWYNDDYDNALLKRGNVFRTKDEAQKHADKLNFLKWFENEIEENSDRIDWGNENQPKYFIYYTHRREALGLDEKYQMQHQGTYYSTNRGHLEMLMKTHGAEIKKYVFEVEE